jgi:hypothetical protein
MPESPRGFEKVIMDQPIKSQTVLKHLKDFCAERSEKRSGANQWDTFLLSVHLEPENAPSPLSLQQWLKEHLATSDVADLIDDYRRVTGLLSRLEETLKDSSEEEWQPKEPAYFLSADLEKPARPGGAPVGLLVRNDDEGTELRLSCSLSPEMRARNPHMLIVGRPETGKNELMVSMIAHDVLCGDRAVVVIDTEGNLSESLSEWLSAHPDKERVRDRITWIDPLKSPESHFNLLRRDSAAGVAADVVSAFKCIYAADVWSQHTDNILRNCIILLNSTGRSFSDLQKLLTEPEFRDSLLQAASQDSGIENLQTLLASWDNYRRLSQTEHWENRIDPLLRKLQPILSNPEISHLYDGGEDAVDLNQFIIEKKVVVVCVPPKRLDDSAGVLFANLLVSRVLGAAASLATLRDHNGQRQVAMYVSDLDGIVSAESLQSVFATGQQLEVGIVGATTELSVFGRQWSDSAGRSLSDFLLQFGCVAAFAVNEEDAQLLSRLLLVAEFEGSEEEKHNTERIVLQENDQFFWRPNNRISSALSMRLFEPSVAATAES